MQENPSEVVLPEPDALPVTDELTTLKARADRLGIQYHPSIKVEKLRAKIAEQIDGDVGSDTADEEDEEPVVEVAYAPHRRGKKETETQFKTRRRQEANALVRIRVSCMNPAKKEWEGEIFTTGNAVVGTIKKYVPFNAEEGWHVPYMLYQQILQRQCQVFYTTKDGRGNSTRKGKLIKEFAVELLPPLTPAELKELAQRQAMAKSID